MTGVFVHPDGRCESDDVGAGTRVWAFAHVLPGAKIGRDCNICGGAFVEGDVVLGDNVTVKNNVLIYNGVTCEDDVFLGPNVVFTNDPRPRAHRKLPAEALLPTVVREGATLGAGVVVVCGTTVGANAFVGAGAVVTGDVPAHAFVVGNPARQRGWVCRCGARLDGGLRCPDCGTSHQVLADSPGLAARAPLRAAEPRCERPPVSR
jgi:UDP-2-acetamido-3-amino-2,3-dideoxy-glucuronate N-acetyltransferase